MYKIIKWKALYSVIEPVPYKAVIFAVQTVWFYKEQYQYGNPVISTGLFS